MLLNVTAGLLRSAGRILVCRRRPEAHMGGLWELPGGKMEEGESPEACLVRELYEELGIRAQVGGIHRVCFHRYDRFDLLLLVYRVPSWVGDPRPLGCADLRWVPPHRLGELRFPPADAELVDELAGESR